MGRISHVILNLYPITKFLVALFFSISIFIIPGYLYAYSLLLVCMFLAFLAGCFKEFTSIVLKALLLIVVFIFLLQSFFYPGDNLIWSWNVFSITQEGVDFALSLTSKIVAVASAIILFFQVTKIKDLVSSLEALGLPAKVTYVFTSTLQLIPEMKKLSLVIMDAQKTRGVETEGNLTTRIKAFLPTLTPLILGSLTGTEEKVLTLESRAFSANVKKTRIYKVEKTIYDRMVRIILLILLIIMILWRVVL